MTFVKQKHIHIEFVSFQNVKLLIMSVAPSSQFVCLNGCYFVTSKDNKKLITKKEEYSCEIPILPKPFYAKYTPEY